MSCTVYLFYPRLCWCFMLILILVFSRALPWLTHIFWLSLFLVASFTWLLNHLFVASARLCFLYAHLHLLLVSIDFGGAMILFCALCIQIQKFLCVHKSWGASLVSIEHSFAHIIISFIHVARRIFGLVRSIDTRWLLASIGIFWLHECLFLSLLCLCGISYFCNLWASI